MVTVNNNEHMESRYRSLNGTYRYIKLFLSCVTVVLGLLYIFQVHTFFGFTLFSQQWAGLFLSLCLILTFLTVPATNKSNRGGVPWYDVILALLSLPAGLWIAINYDEIVYRINEVTNERVFIGIIAILLILEACRRCIGIILVLVALVFILYAKYSSYFPGILQGMDLSWGKTINYLYLDPNSMLSMLGLAATYGLAFVFLGQVLLKFGGGNALTNIALLLFGRTRGGPAKAAVVGSSLAGTVSGAPVSNVFLTGSITIPMMKRAGYPAQYAAAVESVASSGGQIMPPVMGIAAFLIAERLSVPYMEVAMAAIIPAILYYVAVFVQVDLEARKLGLRGLKKEELPVVKDTIYHVWPFIIVIGLLIYMLFIKGMYAVTAGALSGLLAIPISMALKENRTNVIRKLLEVIEETAELSLDVTSALAVAGLIVGAISVSGLGFTLGYILKLIGGNSLILLLLSAAIGSIILGMGMPSFAAYALVAALVAPSLEEFGINQMAVHLFIFYYSIVSNFTPPVAVAAFAAAALAGSSPMKTSLVSTRLGALAYIIPFIFIYHPSLILVDFSFSISFILSLITAVIGTFLIGVALTGYLFAQTPWHFRIGFFISGILLLVPTYGLDFNMIVNLCGLILAVLLLSILFNRRNIYVYKETTDDSPVEHN